MVVHDEDTLSQALSLLEQHGSVRYSDEYAWTLFSNRGTLERYLRQALERDSIAVVVPEGEEAENFYVERTRVLAARRRESKENMQRWFREHPDFAEAYKEASKKPGFNTYKFVSRWKKDHRGLD